MNLSVHESTKGLHHPIIPSSPSVLLPLSTNPLPAFPFAPGWHHYYFPARLTIVYLVAPVVSGRRTWCGFFSFTRYLELGSGVVRATRSYTWELEIFYVCRWGVLLLLCLYGERRIFFFDISYFRGSGFEVEFSPDVWFDTKLAMHCMRTRYGICSVLLLHYYCYYYLYVQYSTVQYCAILYINQYI